MCVYVCSPPSTHAGPFIQKKAMEKTGARPPRGLLTAQLLEQLSKIFATSVDTSAAVREVLASQVTLLGGSATVKDVHDHFKHKLRDTVKRSVKAHRASVVYTGRPGDYVVEDMHDVEEEGGGAEVAS